MPLKFIASKTPDEAANSVLKKHILMSATPQQIDNYIETNVVDLNSAKEVLKILAKLLIIQLRQD